MKERCEGAEGIGRLLLFSEPPLSISASRCFGQKRGRQSWCICVRCRASSPSMNGLAVLGTLEHRKLPPGSQSSVETLGRTAFLREGKAL